ncbi:hypothetical protein [Senegalia massiliensis]|uniref:Uncharacterized protein n=1 Tax=Senegalia massiliensis TaxID=1720316 RepID=A0A845R1V2_9CLOT|nr:hypothetical protein [Senegalia massiliensis]NBI08234.1 hypothetical protein [Senegalia massiliensis]
MEIVLVIVGSLLTFIGLVMMIVNFIRKKPIKMYGVALGLGIVVFIGGAFMINARIEDDLAEAKEATKKQYEQDKKNIKKKISDKEKEIKEKEKEEIEKKKAKGEVELDLAISEREFTVGKSDKNFLDVEDDLKPNSFVKGDSTGKWRKIIITKSVDINEYLLSYKKLYMPDDIESVHVIFNFAYNTTTVVRDVGPYLGAEVYEFVEGEPQDAKKIGTGLLLGEYQIYKDNGDIVDFEKVVEAEENE